MNHSPSAPARRRMFRLAAIATVVFLSAIGAAFATTTLDPAAAPTIQACQLKTLGTIRIVKAASDCNTKLETPLAWNSQGPVGAAGAPGTPGLKGDKGDPGAQGPAGPAGATTLASLSGSACTGHTGLAGTVEIAVTQTDDVVVHCTVASGGGTDGDPNPPRLTALTISRFDATHLTVTVSLDHPSVGDTAVTLVSSDPSAVVAPSTLSVLNGQTTASTSGVVVLAARPAQITASLGDVSITAGTPES